MKYKAEIDVMPLDALLDPQGKAVTSGLHNIGLNDLQNVRIGKHITLEINAGNEEEATKITDEACKKLLANPVMEYYSFKLVQFN